MFKKLSILVLGFVLGSNAINAQTYYSENFESGNGTSWTYSDLDGDGRPFYIGNVSSVEPTFGTKSLVSLSYTGTPAPLALTPDNLVTSPPIVIPAGGMNLYLNYKVYSDTDAPFGAEHYAVYITTVNASGAIIATTPVKEETLPGTGGLQTRSIDISSFLGQTIYLSFRHFNCTDQNYFFVDNIEIKTSQNNDATLLSSNLEKFVLPNSSNILTAVVKNNGLNTITSLQMNWNDGADHVSTITTNIAPGNTQTVTHPTAVSYAGVAQHLIAITIPTVNGVSDSVPADNSGSNSIVVLSQNSPKKVLFEEGTGTWCGWCPRGVVAADYVNTNFPNDQTFVAVHNGDPMTLPEYNNGAGISGFPGMNVDRVLKGVGVSPTTIAGFVNSRKTLPTPVILSGTYSITGNSLVVNAGAQFFSNFTAANYRLAAIVTEDNVSGTTSGYGQTNYYAGGASGVMGGYEALPSPVPATQMVYDHVGRALLGGYNGQANSVPAVITDQQIVNYAFNYTIPATFNPLNMHVVIVLIDPKDGAILNSAYPQKTALSVNDSVIKDSSIVLYPNPATTEFNLKVEKNGKYNVVVYDMSGRIATDYGTVSSKNLLINLPVKLTSGKYLVNISSDGVSYSKNLLVK